MPEPRTATMSAVSWLAVRDHLAAKIRTAHNRMEAATSVKIAEALLRDDAVNVDKLLIALAEVQRESAGGDEDADQ